MLMPNVLRVGSYTSWADRMANRTSWKQATSEETEKSSPYLYPGPLTLKVPPTLCPVSRVNTTTVTPPRRSEFARSLCLTPRVTF